MTPTLPVPADARPRRVSTSRPVFPTGPEAFGEAELLARLRRLEEDACERLVREQTPRLLAVARRILRDEEAARDAVQEAFASAFRNLERFGGQARIATWLHRITVNACLMRLRSRAVRPETSIEDLLPTYEADGHHSLHPPAWPGSPHEILQREEVRALVREAIDQLPPTYRTVLLLRDIEELDTAATAELLGISRAAVKVRLHRARLALRSLLEPALSQGV